MPELVFVSLKRVINISCSVCLSPGHWIECLGERVNDVYLCIKEILIFNTNYSDLLKWILMERWAVALINCPCCGLFLIICLKIFNVVHWYNYISWKPCEDYYKYYYSFNYYNAGNCYSYNLYLYIKSEQLELKEEIAQVPWFCSCFGSFL